MTENSKNLCDEVMSQIEQKSGVLVALISDELGKMLEFYKEQAHSFEKPFLVGRHYVCSGFRRFVRDGYDNNLAFELVGNVVNDVTEYIPVCRLDPGEAVDLYAAIVKRIPRKFDPANKWSKGKQVPKNS